MALNADCVTGSSKTGLSPEQMKMSWPSSAGPLEPDTGASKNAPPFKNVWRYISAIMSWCNVEQSTMTLFLVTAANAGLSQS